MTLRAGEYADPADIVERKELREKGCRVCEHCVASLDRFYCSHPRVSLKVQRRVPYVGANCKFFKLEGC